MEFEKHREMSSNLDLDIVKKSFEWLSAQQIQSVKELSSTLSAHALWTLPNPYITRLILKQENNRLITRINELKEKLPEEKEISSLLKQVSDLGIASGLTIKSWKTGQKATHSSGIVYEIPVSVDVEGTYHNLGYFLSSLTKLNRIVNISDMKLGSPKLVKAENLLTASFKASTFLAVPEAEAAAAAEAASAGDKKSGKKK